MKSKADRLEQLKKAGIDTSQFYSSGNAKATDDVAITNEYANKIVSDGYVYNSKTYRRWIMAQTLRMLNNENGWEAALKSYGYPYIFKMLLEEVRVLGKLEVRNKEAFDERSGFFTKEVVLYTLSDYEQKIKEYLTKLKIKKYHRRPYNHIAGYGNVLVEDLFTTIYRPLYVLIQKVAKASTYEEMYNLMKGYKFVKLPKNTTKANVWIDAYKKSGTYYTFKNMIMFHGVKLRKNDAELSVVDSIKELDSIIHTTSSSDLIDMLRSYTKDTVFKFN